MPAETVLNERPAESTCPLVVEVSEEFEQALRSEYRRLSAEANPTAIEWDLFLEVCILIGLDELKHHTTEEAFELIDQLES